MNADGVWDDGEPTLEDWEIQLYDASGTPVDNQMTGPDGSYGFTGLAEGAYAVGDVMPAGWAQSYPGVGVTGVENWTSAVGGDNVSPDLSPDGTKMAFVRLGAGGRQRLRRHE